MKKRPFDREDAGSPDEVDDDVELIRHEEELTVSTVSRPAGSVRVRKVVEEQPVDDTVTRAVEHAEIERVPAAADDDGEVEHLADGSMSIPVFEEQLVVEKRLVVRERVIVRKQVEQADAHIRTTLRREVVEVQVDEGAEGLVHVDDDVPFRS